MSRRSLYRSSSDKKVAGVCGGLAEWLGWDSTLVRILWVLLTLFGQFFIGVVLYGLLAVLLPLDAEVADFGTGASTGFTADTTKLPFYIGAALLALGAWMLVSRLVPDISRYATPLFFIVVGLALIIGWSRRKEA